MQAVFACLRPRPWGRSPPAGREQDGVRGCQTSGSGQPHSEGQYPDQRRHHKRSVTVRRMPQPPRLRPRRARQRLSRHRDRSFPRCCTPSYHPTMLRDEPFQVLVTQPCRPRDHRFASETCPQGLTSWTTWRALMPRLAWSTQGLHIALLSAAHKPDIALLVRDATYAALAGERVPLPGELDHGRSSGQPRTGVRPRRYVLPGSGTAHPWRSTSSKAQSHRSARASTSHRARCRSSCRWCVGKASSRRAPCRRADGPKPNAYDSVFVKAPLSALRDSGHGGQLANMSDDQVSITW
jgi:hypothetical protein